MALESSSPLKGMLHQVKYILEDEGKRLTEIFKTSASGSSTVENRDVTEDLRRTLADIKTLNSVLSCPIFNNIVNVKDSLDKLSYHLSLHPSISPSDISIDANGELILAPPIESIEPASLNNLINSKLNEYSDQSNLTPHMMSPNVVHNNQIVMSDFRLQNQTQNRSNEVGCSDGFAQLQGEHAKIHNFQQDYTGQTQILSGQNFVPCTTTFYNNEKLVLNSTKAATVVDANRLRCARDTAGELNKEEESPRLYKSNGNFNLNQVQQDDLDLKNNNLRSTQSMDQVGEQKSDSKINGYSNEMYRTTNELSQPGTIAMENSTMQPNGKSHDCYQRDVHAQTSATNGKVQQGSNSGTAYNRSSCSPSSSAGSTVRLADDCDSGPSSLNQPTIANPTVYTPIVYKQNTHIQDDQPNYANSTRSRFCNAEQNLLDNIKEGMEKIKVTLEKDETGLGVTIAGYTCEPEDISGIFIKNITPNSPADRSGKIRILDQIYAVNGRELLGYSNKEAVRVLKHTGRVVTLELMRHLAESKYRNLQSALANVSTTNTTSRPSFEQTQSQIASAHVPSDPIVSPVRSSIPVSKLRDNNQSPTKLLSSPVSKQPVLLRNQIQDFQDIKESHQNEIVRNKIDNVVDLHNSGLRDVTTQLISPTVSYDLQSQIPIAAQRGAVNKIIETKQGARNTIDIKSPVYPHNKDATYVNKVVELDEERKKNSPDEFGRLIRSNEPEWEKDIQIVELYRESSQSLGFVVKDYDDPKDPTRSIIMITSITPGGIAEKDDRLSSGDLLKFVDDINLEGASLNEAVRALKKTSGQVRLGVLKLKRIPV